MTKFAKTYEELFGFIESLQQEINQPKPDKKEMDYLLSCIKRRVYILKAYQ